MTNSEKKFIIIISVVCIPLIIVLFIMVINSSAQSAGFGDICNPSTGSPYPNYNPDLITNPIYASGEDYDQNPQGCSWLLLPFTETSYLTPVVNVSSPGTQYVNYQFVAKAPVTDTFVSVQLNYVDENSVNHPVVFDLFLESGAGWQPYNIDFDGFGSDIGGPNSFVSMQFSVNDNQSDALIDKIRLLPFEPSTATPTITATITSTPTPPNCVESDGTTYYLNDFINGYDSSKSGPGIVGINDLELGVMDSQDAELYGSINRWTYWSWNLPVRIIGTIDVDVFESGGGGQGTKAGFHTDFNIPPPDCPDPSPGNYVCSGTGYEGVPADLSDWQSWSGFSNPNTGVVTASTFFIGYRSGPASDSIMDLDAVHFTVIDGCSITIPTPTPTITATSTTTPTVTTTPTNFPIPTSTASPQPGPTSTAIPTNIPNPTQTPNPTPTGFPIPTIPAPGTPFPIPTPVVGGSCNVETPGNYDFCFDFGPTELECWVIIPTVEIIGFPGFQICFDLYGVVIKVFGQVIPTYLLIIAISFLIIWRWIL